MCAVRGAGVVCAVTFRFAWPTVLVAVVLVVPAPAQAAFPGNNGKVAYSKYDGTDSEIYASNLDGTGEVAITNNSTNEGQPAWSADGRRLAFTSRRDGNDEIYVMNADGSAQTRVTTNPAGDYGPNWSPDGTRIVFISKRDDPNYATCFYCNTEIYVVNVNGTDATRLTNTSTAERYAVWSPDGSKIAFSRQFFTEAGECIHSMNPDGSGVTVLFTAACSNHYDDYEPDWSPDGQKIVFLSRYYDFGAEESFNSVNSVNVDGTGEQTLYQIVPNCGSNCLFGPVWSPDATKITFECYDEFDDTFHQCVIHSGGGVATVYQYSHGDLDWQAVRPPGYARPKAATPTTVRLVPAFRACTSPNGSHGAPLSLGSCGSPQQTSNNLTVGTPDSNGADSNSAGYVKFRAACIPPAPNPAPLCTSPGEQADVELTASLTDVRNKSGLTDYTGELRVVFSTRITDRLNGAGAVHPATVTDTPFGFNLSCVPTAGDSTGSDCSALTSADAVMPGIAIEDKRAVWQLGQVQVYDGGADGDADTAGDNTLFAVQGLFAP
jgi:WD40-like Beta Propeller Repeat